MSGLLTGLPEPEVIESLSYEEIRTAALADFAALYPAYTAELESDPAVKIIEAFCYREMVIRARINDAAKANLIRYATGGNLDDLAGFYDVTRLANETDDALRSRAILAIQARSPGGSKFWYKAAALRADSRIRDVAVYREEFLPVIHVAVLSTLNGGIPDQAMLDAVESEVTSDDTRLINDSSIIVEAAVASTVDIEADVWLLPSAPQGTVDALEQTLRDAWEEEAGIGFDLEPSWIEARLHVPGVKSVDVLSPSAVVTVAPGSAVALGTITINFKGRDK